jgi:uncharacterized protein YhaN
MKSSFALAQNYRIVVMDNDEAAMLEAEQELDARDAELAQLRAELAQLRASSARLAPLAEAAVAYWQARDADDLAALNATSNAVWDAVKAYARARAQDGAA